MPPTRRAASPDPEALTEPAQALAGDGQPNTAPATDHTPGADGPGPARGDRPQPGRAYPEASRPAAKTKVGFYQDPADSARARAAYDWTRPHEGHRSFSDFIAAAVMREVERLEAKHHDGGPWPPLPPGQLPTGKPLGA